MTFDKKKEKPGNLHEKHLVSRHNDSETEEEKRSNYFCLVFINFIPLPTGTFYSLADILESWKNETAHKVLKKCLVTYISLS